MLSRLKFDLSEIIKEKLTYIPNYIWESKTTTFCDLQMAGGQYIKEVVNKLREFGHSDENIKSRVFGFSENEFYLAVIQGDSSLIGIFDVYNNNINMKFDVIVGNPPYQETKEHKKKVTGNGAPWVMFTKNAIDMLKDDGYLSYIIPDSWTAPTYDLMGSRESIFNDYFKKYNLTYINFDVKKYFKGVGIEPSAFILQKNKSYNKTIVKTELTNISIDINSFTFIPKRIDKISLNIHSKLLTEDENTNTIKMRWSKEITNIKSSETEDDLYKYPMIDHHSYKPLRYGNYTDKDSDKIKLLFPYVGKYQVIKDYGKYGAKPQVSILFLKNEKELESAYSFYNSKLISFVMNSNKWTQYLLTQILNYIKTPDFDKIYNDFDLYKQFNLTKEEINYIENYVG